jgi:hypothetical protein
VGGISHDVTEVKYKYLTSEIKGVVLPLDLTPISACDMWTQGNKDNCYLPRDISKILQAG